MAKVKRGEVRFMVATDIAARGIDISDLSHVVNYSLPEDPSVFMHRVGRTGRIGKKGTSLSLVSGAEIMTLSALQKKFSIDFEERKLPTPEEAKGRWTERHVAELKEAMSASIFEAYIPLSQQLKARPDGDYLVAFALKYFFTHHRIEKMTDLQKAEHKRVEHERKETLEKSFVKDRERESRGPREGRRGERERGPRGDREERPREARPPREDRPRPPREDRPRPPREERPAVADADLAGIPTIEVSATLEDSAERTASPVRQTPAREVSAERGAPAEREVAVKRDGGVRAEGGEPSPSRGRVFISWGEEAGADEAKVRALVAASVPGTEPSLVELRRSHTFVEVAPEAVDALVTALNGKLQGEQPLLVERARRRRRR
jgi:ATP-dependent RNA helicase DeaD